MTNNEYKGLLIISRPGWYPDQSQFGAMGKIEKIHVGNGNLMKYGLRL